MHVPAGLAVVPGAVPAEDPEPQGYVVPDPLAFRLSAITVGQDWRDHLAVDRGVFFDTPARPPRRVPGIPRRVDRGYPGLLGQPEAAQVIDDPLDTLSPFFFRHAVVEDEFNLQPERPLRSAWLRAQR